MIISLSQRSEGENWPEIVVTQQVDVQSDPRLQHRLKQGRSGFSSEWAAGGNASGPWGRLTPHEIQQGGNPSLRPGCSRLHLKEISLSAESTTRSRVRLTRSLTCYLSQESTSVTDGRLKPSSLSISSYISCDGPQRFRQFQEYTNEKKHSEQFKPGRRRNIPKQDSADPSASPPLTFSCCSLIRVSARSMLLHQ